MKTIGSYVDTELMKNKEKSGGLTAGISKKSRNSWCGKILGQASLKGVTFYNNMLLMIKNLCQQKRDYSASGCHNVRLYCHVYASSQMTKRWVSAVVYLLLSQWLLLYVHIFLKNHKFPLRKLFFDWTCNLLVCSWVFFNYFQTCLKVLLTWIWFYFYNTSNYE